MFVFDCLLIGLPVSARLAGAVIPADAGRLQILAGEAAALTTPVLTPPVSPFWLAVAFVATLGAAFGGTILGLKMTSFARVRKQDGWREVTYRFRSDSPMRMSGSVFQRLSGILGEIEDLGARIRDSRPAPSPPPTTEAPKLEASKPAAVEHAKPPRREPPPGKPRRDVKFSRREEPKQVERMIGRARWSEDEPRSRTLAELVERPTREDAREVKLHRARRLLKEGHDPATVREITGLKLAALDLIGASPEALGIGGREER